ncbi:MAG: gliding motility lipoprotein GldH [Bacteroidales bacterium]|nr:gliding motility lipoprotein GldH [Bacteroidales bacterium]
MNIYSRGQHIFPLAVPVKNNKWFHSLLLVMGVFLISGCTNDTVYEENIHINNNTWHKDSLAIFKPEINDSLVPYNIYLNLRNTTDYNFRNIFLFMNTQYPNGQVERDTIEILLARKDGEWLGQGYGKLRDSRVLLHRNVHFPQSGMYLFKIQQAMRRKKLKGIADIGLHIEKQQ